MLLSRFKKLVRTFSPLSAVRCMWQHISSSKSKPSFQERYRTKRYVRKGGIDGTASVHGAVQRSLWARVSQKQDMDLETSHRTGVNDVSNVLESGEGQL